MTTPRTNHVLNVCGCSKFSRAFGRREILLGATAIAAEFFCCGQSSAQELWSDSLERSCSFYDKEQTDKEIYTFKGTKDAQNTIEKITDSVGLPANFKILAANVPNAMAIIKENERYVLYSENFIQQIINSSSTEWAAYTIMAHEVGHHLSGHTLLSIGSRPALELQADKFAGFAVARMGGTLEQAQACYRKMSQQGSETHPGRNARIEAVTLGWRQAQSSKEAPPIKEKIPDPEPSTAPPPESGRNPIVTMQYILQALAQNNLNLGMVSPQVAMLYQSQRFAIAQRLQFAGQVVNVAVTSQQPSPDGNTFYNFGVRFVQTYMTFQLGLSQNGMIVFLSFQ